jgi:hypothetical protein
MEPRLPTSQKWTRVPADYADQVVAALAKSFPAQSEKGEWIFEGRIYPEELFLVVGYLQTGRLKQVNFEVSLQYRAGVDNVPDLLNLAVDVGASLLEEAFKADSDADFPRVWQEYTIEKRAVYIQYTVENTKLEREADKLLGLDQEQQGLVQGTDAEDDAEALLEALKAKLGVDPETLDEDEEPLPPRGRGEKH